MRSAKTIRAKCEQDLDKLQATCKHPQTYWETEATARGQGRQVLVCKFCDKVLKTSAFAVSTFPVQERAKPDMP